MVRSGLTTTPMFFSALFYIFYYCIYLSPHSVSTTIAPRGKSTLIIIKRALRNNNNSSSRSFEEEEEEQKPLLFCEKRPPKGLLLLRLKFVFGIFDDKDDSGDDAEDDR